MFAMRFYFLVSLSLAITRAFDYYGQTTYCPPGGVPVCATNGMQTKYFANQCQMDLLNMKMQLPYIATSLSNCMSYGRQVNAYSSVRFSPVRYSARARYPSYGGHHVYSTTTPTTTTSSTEPTTTRSSCSNVRYNARRNSGNTRHRGCGGYPTYPTTTPTTTSSTSTESSTTSLPSSTESTTVASSNSITTQQLMLSIQFPSGWSFNMTILAPLSTNSISTPSVILRLLNKEAC